MATPGDTISPPHSARATLRENMRQNNVGFKKQRTGDECPVPLLLLPSTADLLFHQPGDFPFPRMSACLFFGIDLLSVDENLKNATAGRDQGHFGDPVTKLGEQFFCHTGSVRSVASSHAELNADFMTLFHGDHPPGIFVTLIILPVIAGVNGTKGPGPGSLFSGSRFLLQWWNMKR